MSLSQSSCERLVFFGLEGISDGTALLHSQAGTKGRITLELPTAAWTTYFQDLPEKETPLDRFLNSHPRELAGRFIGGTPAMLREEEHRTRIYLMHCIREIQDEITAHLEKAAKNGQL